MASVRLRPEVDEPDRLDALRPDLVEVGDAIRALTRGHGRTASSRRSQERMLLSSWRRSSSSKPSVSCSKLPRMALELLAHAVALALERLAQHRAFAAPALAELLARPRPPVPLRAARAAAAARRRPARATRAAGSQSASGGWWAPWPSESSSSSEAARLGLARVGLERPVSPIRLDPARRDRDQLLVQPLGAAARTAIAGRAG